MALAYDVTGHPLLSEGAAALGPTELEANTRVAIALLLLDTFTIDPITQVDDFEQARNAIALQVSYQVESGMDAFIASEIMNGQRRTIFRGGQRRMSLTHGAAKKIATQLRPKPTSVLL